MAAVKWILVFLAVGLAGSMEALAQEPMSDNPNICEQLTQLAVLTGKIEIDDTSVERYYTECVRHLEERKNG